MSDSLQPHGVHHARIPCPSPTPGACSNLCPSSWWCHPTILFSCLQSFQHQGIFQWVSSSHQVAKVLELELQHQHQPLQWIFRADFLYDWLIWSPCSPRDSQESSPTPQFKTVLSFLYSPTLTSMHATGKTIALTRWTFVGKVMSLLLNILSRLVITFLPRSKYLLISCHHLQWFWSSRK